MPYLVLSRRKSEIIRIGDDIDIMVVDIRKGSVRIGVSAPKDTPVHRLEVYEAIQREQAAASPPKVVGEAEQAN